MFDELNSFDVRSAESGEDIVRSLHTSQDPLLRQLLEWQASSITSEEMDFSNGMLATGILREIASSDRGTAIALARRIDQRAYLRGLRRRFASYEPTQPLFLAIPSLFEAARRSNNRPADLLAARALPAILLGNRILTIGSRYGVIDYALPLPALQAALDCKQETELFVRLDPEKVYDKRPLESLNEEVVRPIDPHWWKEFRVYQNESTGLALELQPPINPADDFERYYDYHSRGMRKLEMSVIRRGNNYFTVMVEELEQSSCGLMGRCVHTDAFVEPGTLIDSCAADHLDMSVNWYEGDSVAHRLSSRLDQKRKTAADIHTHLMRVDGAPFSLFFTVAHCFFRSTVLTREWRDAQQLAGR